MRKYSIIAIMVVLVMCGCRKIPRRASGVDSDVIFTQITLSAVKMNILKIGLITRESPPFDNELLLAWFVENGVPLHRFFIEDDRLLDSWGNELHIIRVSPTAMQVGSSGPNGQWEQGQGDDILGDAIDLSVTTGPPLDEVWIKDW
jgi:hypothetical protein